MKKFLKCAVACGMMAVVSPLFVGCDSTPAWQRAESVNTSAEYTESSYTDIHSALSAEGENAIENSDQKIKVSMQMLMEDMDILVAGVIDSNATTGVNTALRIYMGMDGFSANIIVYVTDEYWYYDMTAGGENIKLKIDATELEDAEDIVSMYNTYMEQLKEAITIEKIIEAFTILSVDQSKFVYEVATEDDGVTKYKVELISGQVYTVTSEDEEAIIPVSVQYSKDVAYIAVKENKVVELYEYSISSVEMMGYNMETTTTICLKEYAGEMPTVNDESYMTMLEYMQQLSELGGL